MDIYESDLCPCERCQATRRPVVRSGGECGWCEGPLFYPGERCPCRDNEPLPFGWAHVRAIGAAMVFAAVVVAAVEIATGAILR